MNRIGIFVFYDSQGRVDAYIPYLLRGFKNILNRLVIVVNGKLSDEGRATLSEFSDEIIIRENNGFDTWAYKEGMDYVGRDGLLEYDEVVIFNDTVMGPIYPFEEMFSEMEKRDLDFWGITCHYKDMANPYGCIYGYTPAHIQSYFEVFNKRFVGTDDFREYWENLPEIESYVDAVGKHETVFTKKFADMGYRWDVYVNTPELEKKHSQPLMAYADEIIEKYRCPIFKKRLFFNDYEWYINTNIGQSAIRVLDYLKKNTDYPTEYILDTLIHSRNLRELYMNFHWNYVCTDKIYGTNAEGEAILIALIQSEDVLSETLTYLRGVPEEIRVCIVANDVLKKSISGFEVLSYSDEWLTSENVKNFFELIDGYDYAGFITDIDIEGSFHKPMDEAVCYKQLESIVGGGEYIYNVLSTLSDEKRLAILTVPTLNHGVYIEYVSDGWQGYFDRIKELLQKLNNRVSISKDISPIIIQGLCMWAKTDALLSIRDDIICIIDKCKPDECEGILSRSIPYLLQDKGYVSGYVTNSDFAALELDNREYQLATAVRERNDLKEKFLSAGGKRRLLIKQILKFGVVGGICFLIDFVIYTFIANLLGINILIAGFFGFTISVIVNYILSMKFVFERREDMTRTKELIIFILMSVVGLGINEVILYVCKEMIYSNWVWLSSWLSNGWANIGAKVIATGIVMVYNFISRKLVLEKKS